MYEPAHRAAFGYGIIPWAFEEGIRSPLPPLTISLFFRVSESVFGGGPRVYITTARIALAVFSLTSVAAVYLAARRRSPSHGLIVGLVAAMWFELVYFASRPLLEAISLNFLFIATSIAWSRDHRFRRMEGAILGLCLAMTVLVRLEFAIPVLILLAWVAWSAPRATLIALALGASAPCLAFGIADWIVWGAPFASYVSAVRVNLFEGVASSFGVMGYGWYFSQLLTIYGVALTAILLALNVSGWAEHKLWTIIGVAIILSHSLIPHKEYRFVLPGFVSLVIAAALACSDLVVLYSQTFGASWGRKAHIVVIALWAAISCALALGPGFRSNLFRLRDDVSAALWLSDRTDLCGLLVYAELFPGYAFLHHNIPVYLSGYSRIELSEGLASVPQTQSFNFIVGPEILASRIEPTYRSQVCLTGLHSKPVCVFRRDGPCTPTGALVPALSQFAFGRYPPDMDWTIPAQQRRLNSREN